MPARHRPTTAKWSKAAHDRRTDCEEASLLWRARPRPGKYQVPVSRWHAGLDGAAGSYRSRSGEHRPDHPTVGSRRHRPSMLPVILSTEHVSTRRGAEWGRTAPSAGPRPDPSSRSRPVDGAHLHPISGRPSSPGGQAGRPARPGAALAAVGVPDRGLELDVLGGAPELVDLVGLEDPGR